MLAILLLSFFAGDNLKSQTLADSTRQSVSSPDNNYHFIFYQQRTSAGKKQMYYELTYKGKPVINKSELGILVNNNLYESALNIPNDSSKLWCENLDLIKTARLSRDETWKPVYGERSIIPDHYNEMILELEKYGPGKQPAESADPRRVFDMHVIVRAYNEGVAFRYYFPENEHGVFVHIDGEQTQFAMPEGTMAWFERWAEAPYQYLPLKNWKDESERPLTMKLKNGLTVSLTEAMMIDYARTKFRLDAKKPETLLASMYGNVDVTTPYATPWRVIMAADTPGKLVENNYLILNLNPGNKIPDTSWIKPGKVFRSGLTTQEALASVDFASSRNLQYVHLDAGWYGNQMHVDADASKAVSPQDLDLHKLIEYGASKNIGIILYVNQRALTLQIDSLFPLYQQWGLKGVKFGFVHTGSQYWSVWLHDAIKKAAQYKLMVDVHDEYRPTGFSRTYPNLMTQEGIRGNEEMPDATHTTILPFTRYLAGAGDNTICYYNNRIKTTHAHQLAMAVISYSPLQYMYWYDKPAFYGGEPEVEFFDRVKTVWDDTRVLSGEPGQHIVMARKSGEEWFVGVLTNNDARNLELPLDFMDAGKKYVARIYTDDDKIKTKTRVKAVKFIADRNDVIKFALKASGGAAIDLMPATPDDIKVIRKLPKSLF